MNTKNDGLVSILKASSMSKPRMLIGCPAEGGGV